MLPASHTKHSKVLACPHPLPSTSTIFQLGQSDDGVSNGTALWLGAQCLSAYLIHSGVVKSKDTSVIELGSGIGFTALSLAHLGCHVIATDLPWVISSNLARNIESNTRLLPFNSGTISVRELDWNVVPDRWIWDNSTIIASPDCSPDGGEQRSPRPFDYVISADTVYSMALIDPLLRSIHALVKMFPSHPSVAFICLERRDPAVCNRFLSEAAGVWSFSVSQVPPRKVSMALKKSQCHWDKEEWEGIEIWKLVLRQS